MVQDYHYLNEWTIKNNYPLPLISQLVDKLKGCKLFMKMDLWWGYVKTGSSLILSFGGSEGQGTV